MASELHWTVRPVTRMDEPSWRTLYRGYRGFYGVPPDEKAIDTVWDWLNDDDHESEGFVIVERSGLVGGLAHVRKFPRLLTGAAGLFLDDLFVDPDLRGRGLGRALLEYLSGYAASEDLGVVRWITAEDNVAARVLYDSEATATRWVTYDMPSRIDPEAPAGGS